MNIPLQPGGALNYSQEEEETQIISSRNRRKTLPPHPQPGKDSSSSSTAGEGLFLLIHSRGRKFILSDAPQTSTAGEGLFSSSFPREETYSARINYKIHWHTQYETQK
jgi:hypothetical protein